MQIVDNSRNPNIIFPELLKKSVTIFKPQLNNVKNLYKNLVFTETTARSPIWHKNHFNLIDRSKRESKEYKLLEEKITKDSSNRVGRKDAHLLKFLIIFILSFREENYFLE